MMIKIKKKNPTDEKFLKSIKIEKYTNNNKFSHNVVYLAILNNKSLAAEAVYDIITGNVELIVTKESYRRKGLANHIYNYIEKDLNIELTPSDYLLSDGKEFWNTRLRRKSKLVI